MLAAIALLTLALQAPASPEHVPEVPVADEEHDRDLVEARAAIERASAALEAGEIATARTQVELALERLAPLPLGEGRDETAELLWYLGFLAHGAGSLPAAREAWGRVVAHREQTLPEDHPDLLAARGNLGGTMKEMGELAGARALFEAVLAGLERSLPDDHPNLLGARGNLAVTMQAMGDFAAARVLQESVLASLERIHGEVHPEVLRARGNLAITMESQGDLAGARALYETVVADLERVHPDDHPALLDARQRLADAMRQAGDLDEARALQEAVLAARERTLPGDHPAVLRARGNLGATLQASGRVAQARALFEDVLAGLGRIYPRDHRDVLRARGNLAVTLKQMGDLAAARALEEAVLADLERTYPEDHPELLRARANLALTMDSMGDRVGARALLESVLAVRERIYSEDHPLLLTPRLNLAATKRAMGDLDGARALFDAVLASSERIYPEDHPALLAARLSLAVTLKDMGDLDGARAIEEAALAALERVVPAEHPNRLVAIGNLAGTLRRMGDLAGALALFEEELAIRERIYPEGHPDLLGTLQNLVGTLMETGDAAGARARGLELARGMLRRLELASALSPREAREAARTEAARQVVVRFATEPKPGEEVERVRFDLAETLRATSSLSGGTAAEDDPRRRALAEIRGRLNDTVSGGPTGGESGEELAARIARLTFERDRLEREIRGERAARGLVAGAVRADEIARALPEGSAAVGFLRHGEWTLDREAVPFVGDVLSAHVLLPDGSLTEVELGGADELEELARAWRAALGQPVSSRGLSSAGDREASGSEDETGERLRRLVLDPVLARVGGATTLYVCLDDFLHVVPIGALPLETDGEGGVVRDRYTIVNEVSFARLSTERPAPESEPGLLAVGDVAFGSETRTVLAASTGGAGGGRGAAAGFGPLGETRGETEFAAALFERELHREPVLLLEGDATKTAFHEHVAGKRYVHVATHGWFEPETTRSWLDSEPGSDRLWSALGAQETVTGLAPMTLCGLAFAGANRGRDSLGRVPGIMTAEELAGADLSACELAVLSACETNVGIRRAGQGIQSLQTALLAAGARTAITSLWKVDDAATRELMERFYTYLWVEGMGRADALWKAKCDLRSEGYPVRDWAAWILSGDPE